MPTHYKGSSGEIATLNAFIKLTRASNTLHLQLSRSLANYKLTESQFGVLEALYHLGPLNQRSLGEKILKSGGNITMVIVNLEKQGWVTKTKDQNDKRSHTITLTADGKRIIEEVFPGHLQRISELFSCLEENELAELSSLCKKLGVFASQWKAE